MTMLRPLAQLAHRRRWPMLALFAALLIAAALYGVDAPEALDTSGFEAPGSPSHRAGSILEEKFGMGQPDVVVAYSHPSASARDPRFARALEPILDRLAEHPSVENLSSPYDPAAPAPVSRDGRSVLIAFQIAGDGAEEQHIFEAIEPSLRSDELASVIGGTVPATLEAQQAAEEDLVRGELIALPLVALLLVIFFRGILASMPLLLGGFAVAAALASLRALANVTEVSMFAMNIVTFLGLGLAVDYSLFMTSRFRDELAAGRPVEEAVEATVTTAGRTIAYSGIAVGASLLCLLVFPILLIRSVAIAGSLVVLMAVIATLVFLPAGLSVLGPRVHVRAPDRAKESKGAWYRISHMIMRAPVITTVVTAVLLLLLGTPFLRLKSEVGGSDLLPPGSQARALEELVSSRFAVEQGAIEIVLITDEPVASEAGTAGVERYVNALSRLDGVGRIHSQRIARGHYAVVRVDSTAPPRSDARSNLVERVRDVSVPGVDALVGGSAARLLDIESALVSRLPWALGLIGLSTFIVLFLAFGSVVMPLKAIVMNVLSLTASFGALVWIFQDGRFEGLLDYQSSGSIELTIPVVMFSVVFGLSMDYELFLLSRIREAYLETSDTRTSVAVGLMQTGRIITRAALLLIAVMLGFIGADMLLIKELGVGMAVAIAVDVTIVRVLLVPATMELLGRYNWWAPRWLDRAWHHLGIGIEESGPASMTAR